MRAEMRKKRNEMKKEQKTAGGDGERGVVDVVAALLRSEDGKFLIFQRPPQKARGLLWEFVGGKVEEGESHKEALARECMEELGARVRIGGLFAEVTHEYPDLTIRLFLYHAVLSQEPRLFEHCAMSAVTPAQFDEYDFCPADRAILDMIKQKGDSI